MVSLEKIICKINGVLFYQKRSLRTVPQLYALESGYSRMGRALPHNKIMNKIESVASKMRHAL